MEQAMKRQLRRAASLMAVAAFGLSTAGCENKAQTGALLGSAAGAGIGAIIGHQSGHAAGGALIGAAVGAGGGYIAGNEMDKKDQREREASYYQNTRAAREGRYAEPAGGRVSTTDVIRWTDQGVKDEVIIDRIERSGAVMRLSVADENELRDAGVDEEVIRTMKNTARR
jgi:uncharacterized protein YcfJ